MRERTYYSFQQPKLRSQRARLMRFRDVTPATFNWRNMNGTIGNNVQSDVIQMVGTTNQITFAVTCNSPFIDIICYVSANVDKTGIINSVTVPNGVDARISMSPGSYVWFDTYSDNVASSTVTIKQQLLNAVTLDTFVVTYS